MPLNTEILRDGETLPIRWGHFHLAAMIIASAIDSDWRCLWKDEPIRFTEQNPAPVSPGDCWNLVGYHVIGATPLNGGEYVLQRDHKFIDTADGEILDLRAGDVLKAWRN